MLSPDGKCHSFDDRANGYVRADGVGAILLESPSLGAGRGVASLLGTGSNSDGTKPKVSPSVLPICCVCPQVIPYLLDLSS